MNILSMDKASLRMKKSTLTVKAIKAKCAKTLVLIKFASSYITKMYLGHVL